MAKLENCFECSQGFELSQSSEFNQGSELSQVAERMFSDTKTLLAEAWVIFCEKQKSKINQSFKNGHPNY